MLVAKVENGSVTQVADYREMFPNTVFPNFGPNEAFFAENGLMRVNVFKPHDRETEQLVTCHPYIDGDWVYTVEVQPMNAEQLAARDALKQADNKARASALLSETDYLVLADVSAQIVNGAEIVAYRAALRDIALNPPVNVAEWPSRPVTEWVA